MVSDQLKRLVHAIMEWALAPATAIGGAQVHCPAQVNTRQQIAAPVPVWSTSLDDSPHWLAVITFFDGSPSEKASLAPDSESKVKESMVSTWNFGSTGRPVW